MDQGNRTVNEIAAGMVDMRIIPQVERENLEHNVWRYHELQRLRLGQANRYLETEYR